jgi:FtsZ-interacting cell division protein ZipA
MTDLQASLIAIGGVIVTGVISFNKWQEYKARKSIDRAFASSNDDVLMSPEKDPSAAPLERQEPVFANSDAHLDTHTDTVNEPADISQGQSPTAPMPSEGAHNAAPTSAPKPAPPIQLPVDELVDCMIALTLEQPVRGDKVIGPIQALRHVGNKPVHYIGLQNGDQWQPISHGGYYTALQAGVQLANRSNPLNEIEYSEMVSRLRTVADEIGAEPDVPDMTAVMRSARALHQFITEFDAQLSVNIQSNGAPWAINTLLIALEKQGFDLRPEGRLVMPDGDGGVLFSLSTNVTLAADMTSRLTLLLDVPCVSRQRNGFGAMIACARSLALRMSGTVVDDSNQPLTEQALADIALQVKEFYANMEAAEIPAGSARALRLFS